MNQRRVICLEITGKCGLNCLHCSSFSNHRNTDQIDIELIYRVLDEGFELKFNELALSGGDPFLHPNFFQIIKYAKSLGYYVNTYTNGNILNKESLSPVSIDIYKKLEKAKLDKLTFSLHSTQKKIHDKITGVNGSYDNLITSLNRSMEFTSFEKEINLVIMKINYRNLNTIEDFLQKYKLNKLHLIRFVPHGRGKENLNLLEIDKHVFKDAIEKFYNQKSTSIEVLGSSSLALIKSKINNFCRAVCNNKLCITPTGDAFPCVAMKNTYTANLSNNVKNLTLKEIIQESIIFKAVSTNFANRFASNHDCLDCPAQIFLKSEMENLLIVS